MVWFYVDDGLAFHTKTIQAGNSAMGLWVRAGAWSAASLTDGYIPTAIARSIGTPEQVSKLVRSGLWDKRTDGYSFHDWDHRQPSKADVEQKRKADRARKREQRRGRNVPPGQPPGLQTESAVDTLVDSSRVLPQGCVPLPSPPLNGGGVGNATHHADNTGPPPCPKHPDGYKHDQPCRECGRLREYDQNRKTAEVAAAAKAHTQRRNAIDACPYCDDNGLREINEDTQTRCTHNPDTFAEEPF